MILRKTMLSGNSIDDNTISRTSYKPIVILPGTINGNHSEIKLGVDDLRMHILLMGATGSGKTNTIRQIIPQIQRKMCDEDILLVFDSKLDFEYLHRDEDYVISCKRGSKGNAVIWNLFKEIVADGWGKDAISANADEVADIIFYKTICDSSQPFFPRAAKDIFAAIIKAMTFIGIEDKDYRVKHLNNASLIKYLNKLDGQRLQEFLSAFPELSGVLKYVGNGGSEQALGVFAELQSVVCHVFARDFGMDGRFSVRKSVKDRNGKALFIEYDPASGKTLQPIYQMLFDLFLKEALSPNRNSRGNVYVVCDELKMLPQLNHFEDALNFGRSLGVSIIVGIQSMEQLYEVYGEYGGKNIASAFQSIFCFHTNDVASRQYIKGVFGENISVIQYMTPSGKTIEEKHIGNSVEDWEISALKLGEAIIGLPYQKPVKFKFEKIGG